MEEGLQVLVCAGVYNETLVSDKPFHGFSGTLLVSNGGEKLPSGS